MKQLKTNFSSHSRMIAIAAAAIALLSVVLLFRLGSLTHGQAAPVELASQYDARSWSVIVHNPLNAPYTIVQRLVGLSGHHGITSLRLVSTLFAALAAVLFYFVARQWHSTRVALLASWLFISSAWFLHIGRLGSPDILGLVSILTIVVLLTPNKHGRQTSLALPSTLVILSTLLYVPGMVWLVLAGVVVQLKNLREAWVATKANWLRLISIVGSLAILAPLIYALEQSPALVKQWLGLSAFSPALLLIAHNLVNVPKSLVYSSSFDSVHWLGHLPLLSSFEIVMLLLGAYFYASHIKAARTRLIGSLALVAWLLIGLIGLNSITLVIPVTYLLVAAGIAYMLHLWLKVFPNNPLARWLGIAIIMLAVLLTSVYQTRSYFVAWRYNSATDQAFQRHL